MASLACEKSEVCSEVETNLVHNYLKDGRYAAFVQPMGLDKLEEYLICSLKEYFYQHYSASETVSKMTDGYVVLEALCLYVVRRFSEKALEKCSHEDNHLGIMDWYMVYLQDVIRYEFLAQETRCKRFPYMEDTVNNWFRLPEEKQNVDERNNKYVININKEGKDRKLYNSSQNGGRFPEGLVDENHYLLFHGTDHEGAVNIIEDGIDIQKSWKSLDFSNGRGFYLNDKLSEAEQWGFSKSSRPAVLVYRVQRDILESYREGQSIDLRGEESVEEWVEVVVQFRSGRPDKQFLRGIKRKTFIEGPMASVGRAFNRRSIQQRAESYQMCLISYDLAEEFDNFLHSIIFYNTRQ